MDKLTPTQQLFYDKVIELIDSDDKLARFFRAKASGKTFVLNKLDEAFDDNAIEDSAFFDDNPHLTDETRPCTFCRGTGFWFMPYWAGGGEQRPCSCRNQS